MLSIFSQILNTCSVYAEGLYMFSMCLAPLTALSKGLPAAQKTSRLTLTY